MKQNNVIIGVFDSGIGGMTILSEIVDLLPNVKYIYYGDGESLPLGEKSREQIIEVSDRAVAYLVAHGAQIVVLACNTVTSVAKDYLRSKYKLPIVGIEPAVKMASAATKTGTIGVIATKSTIEGEMLHILCKKWAPNIEVILKIGYGLVEMVEKPTPLTDDDTKLLSNTILELADKGVDIILLGCTHYPFLRSEIEKILEGRGIEVVDPAPFVARRVCDILKERALKVERGENSNSPWGNIEFVSSLGDDYNKFMKKKYIQLKGTSKL